MTPSEYRDKKAEDSVWSTVHDHRGFGFCNSCLSNAIDLNKDRYKAGFIEGRKYTLTQDEVILNLMDAIESAEAALAVSTVVTHGQYTPDAFGLKELKIALAKFEELKKEVSE